MPNTSHGLYLFIHLLYSLTSFSHSSMQNTFSCLMFEGFLALTSCLKSPHSILIRLGSELWFGHSILFIYSRILWYNKEFKVNGGGISSSVGIWLGNRMIADLTPAWTTAEGAPEQGTERVTAPRCTMASHCCWLGWVKCRGHILHVLDCVQLYVTTKAATKQPHTMTLPSPCCKVCMRFLCSNFVFERATCRSLNDFLGLLETSWNILQSALGLHLLQQLTWPCLQLS